MLSVLVSIFLPSILLFLSLSLTPNQQSFKSSSIHHACIVKEGGKISRLCHSRLAFLVLAIATSFSNPHQKAISRELKTQFPKNRPTAVKMMTKLYKHGLATPRSDLRSASLVICISYGLYRAAQRMETPGGWNRPVVDLPHRAGACFVAGNSQRLNLFVSCFARSVHAVLNSNLFFFLQF